MGSLAEQRAKRKKKLEKEARKKAARKKKQDERGHTLIEQRAEARKKRIPFAERRASELTLMHRSNIEKAKKKD